MISVILPTFNEAENIPIIIPKIFSVFKKINIKAEVIVVDDNSPDGTYLIAQKLSETFNVRVIVRQTERGLATAVMCGFSHAKGEICVVMDADMSHPVESLPQIVEPIIAGVADVAVGSRYMEGRKSENWSLLRKIISKGAGLLAKGLTSLSDPTSGFIASRKSLINSLSLNPIGWKIALEIVVKANTQRLIEVPIVFSDREFGHSKLNMREQINYIRHLLRLYNYKFSLLTQFVKFCIVGFSGIIIDTAVLVSIVEFLFVDPRVAAVFAYLTAVSWNYFLNSKWTFKRSGESNLIVSYMFFVILCTVGLGLRILVMHILIEDFGLGENNLYILASLIGIAFASIWNFLGSKYIVFAIRRNVWNSRNT